MVTRFGSREICDVTFKAATSDFVLNGHPFKAGQPVFIIDTATASSMEQATTTVYAQGGRGYNRLIAWEGEKTITFNVTDALMSPLGLAMLTGAGLGDATATNAKHIHLTIDTVVKEGGIAEVALATLVTELGLPGTTTQVEICKDHSIKTYATVLDHNGALIDWVDEVEVENEIATAEANATFKVDTKFVGKTIKLDFYVVMYDNLTEITISPDDFGGFFYVEADTLYRNQDGKDMAATITFPRVKIQSGFTLSMAPTGDPSTFDFVMDAFPAYTYFDQTKKVVCDIAIVGGAQASNETPAHNPDHGEEPGPTPVDPTTAVSAMANDQVIFGHTVGDLQDGIIINAENGTITGTLKEVTTGELPSYWTGYTHFIALNFTPDEGIAPEDVKVGITRLTPLDSDLNGAWAINADSLTPAAGGLKVITTKNGEEYTKVYDISGLTLA